MTGQELEVRKPQGVALAPALADAGVQIEEHDGRFRSISFPEAARARFNLLLPVEELVQADPNYTPTLRAVTLNPSKDGPHFYNQQGRLAPRKQALEALADAAGIKLARARPLSKEELSSYEEGSLGFEATVELRRSDGTPRTISASKIWEPGVARYSIEVDLQNAGKPKDGPDFRKRWLAELQHKAAKTESKAILRAIRAALQIPHTFTQQEAGKPFVVVGYSFTPDYTDPEVLRLVLEKGLGSARDLYGQGGRQALEQAGGGRDTAPAEELEPQEAAAQPADSSLEAEEPGRASQPAPGSEALFEGAEPPAPEPAAEEKPDHGAFVLPPAFKRYAGKTLREVLDAGDTEYLNWLRSDAVGEPVRGEAKAFAAQLREEAACS